VPPTDSVAFFGAQRKLTTEIRERCKQHAGKVETAMARVNLGPDGAITKRTLLLEPTTSPALRDCLDQAVASAKLPKPPAGTSVTVLAFTFDQATP